MFDANYFKKVLPREIEAVGGSPVVEVALLNGHVHRVRAVTAIEDGYVTIATHQSSGDLSHERPRFGVDATGGNLIRVAVSYDGIAAVVVDPAPDKVKGRPGFAG